MRLTSAAAICAAHMILAAAAAPALAAPLDTDKPFICATLTTVECVPGEDCLSGPPSSINAPRFIHLDVAKKEASAERPSGEVVSSTFDVVEAGDAQVVLQGLQNGRAWSLVVDRHSKAMTFTAAMNDAAFVVFGACTDG